MGQWFEEFEEVVPDYVDPGLFIRRETMIDLGQIVGYSDMTIMNKDPEDYSKSIIYLRSGRAITVVESYETITNAIRKMMEAKDE